MKNIFHLVVFFIYGSIANSQVINIPDPNFKSALLAEGIDTNFNGQIEVSEATTVIDLFIENANISDLTGISYFANLHNLYGNYNNLTSINISGLNYINKIELAHNQLANFDGLSSPTLFDLYLPDNPLQTINLSGLHNLYFLTISESNLQVIDANDLTFIGHLYFENNPQLTQLYIKNGRTDTDLVIIGNPNLQSICADASEVSSVQSQCNAYGYNCLVSSNCSLGLDDIKYTTYIYPNPVNDYLHLSNLGSGTISSISIYNSLGQLVFENPNSYDNYRVDVSQLARGNYFMKISIEGRMFYEKFIKE